jgi:hypothetical protein
MDEMNDLRPAAGAAGELKPAAGTRGTRGEGVKADRVEASRRRADAAAADRAAWSRVKLAAHTRALEEMRLAASTGRAVDPPLADTEMILRDHEATLRDLLERVERLATRVERLERTQAVVIADQAGGAAGTRGAA